eukprot:CAMPEP_0179437092 /NCGR_PEP_ID=MMETSP0799-20121207/21042_1 /TAXON_ID=46947 /ORGANISM="Geminigera cryophila, Strain CCMP2564" /LENGTH=248 /DNA_ID=CAMNT_0021217797 /DNA_START=219 /DNA_END=965 /DNA_ORIENTATION=+
MLGPVLATTAVVSTAVATSAAILCTRVRTSGLTRVNIPVDSLLAAETLSALPSCYADAFQCRVAVHRGETVQEVHDRFLRAFFRSRVFQVERALLSALEPTLALALARAVGSNAVTPLTHTSDEDIERMTFKPGQNNKVAIFTMTDRRDMPSSSETIFQWSDRGRTWMCTRDPRVVVAGGGAATEVEPIFVDVLFGSALLNVAADKEADFGTFALIAPLHRAYSCILLAEAAHGLGKGSHKDTGSSST